jgi:hypothetical protein
MPTSAVDEGDGAFHKFVDGLMQARARRARESSARNNVSIFGRRKISMNTLGRTAPYREAVPCAGEL